MKNLHWLCYALLEQCSKITATLNLFGKRLLCKDWNLFLLREIVDCVFVRFFLNE